MSRPADVADYREAARRKLPHVLFEYVDGAAYAEQTLRANTADFQALKLRQRVLRDVSNLSLKTEILGIELTMPLLLGPIGMAGMYARRGECQAAAAAKAAGIPFCLSSLTICDVDEVAKVEPPWFQLYMLKDRGFMTEYIARAAAAKCPVMLFTVDLPVPGTRYRDVRTGLSGPPQAFQPLLRAWDGITHPGWLWDVQINGGPHSFGNIAAAVPEARGLGDFWGWIGRNFDASITWADIDWIRQQWKGPFVLKGILDPEDAREAKRIGVDGIVVSNHGGRQLDGASSTIAALPAIAEAVDGGMPVLLDGGVRSGLDVVKALASGADACLIGRAWAWALGAAGEKGVAHVISVIRSEMLTALALTGCPDVRDAGRELLDI
ncbi:MAG TPA: L-lactate dehydrogenase [Caulobacteraceae bacterium]|nr:L-lactate dehydrogenase [Caulobacteraceae bacterium]